MAFTFGFSEIISLAGFANQLYTQRVSFNEAAITAQKENASNALDAKLRGIELEANLQIIGEQKALEGIDLGYDLFDIAFETRKAKASAMAERAQPGSVSLESYKLHFNNIDRQGRKAAFRRNLNYGTRVRNLDIETTGLRRNVLIQNLSTSFVEGPSATGLQLAQIGLAIDTVKELGFVKDPKTGKTVSRFS